MVAKAAIQAPALDVLSRPIVPAQITDPARVHDLRRDAQAKLAIGPGLLTETVELRVGTRGKPIAEKSLVKLEVTPPWNSWKTLAEANGCRTTWSNATVCADPHTKTTEDAFDVFDCQDPRRNAPTPDDNGPRDIHWIDMSS